MGAQTDGIYFKITKIIDVEYESKDERTDARMLLILQDETEAELTLEMPFSLWKGISEAVASGLQYFPDGGLAH